MDRLLYRVKEIECFHTLLENVNNFHLHKGGPEIIYVSGTLKAGKTFLLDEVQRSAAARGIPVSRVDFSPNAEIVTDGYRREKVGDRYAGVTSKITLIQSIMDGLIRAADAVPSRYVRPDDLPQTAIEVFIEYNHWLKGFLKRSTMLIFDHLDMAPPEIHNWLMTALIPAAVEASQKPINMYGPAPTLMALAGRKPLYDLQPTMPWSALRKTKELPIRPFTREQTKTMAKKDIYPLTGGLPGLIQYIKQLSDDELDPTEQIKNVVEQVILPEIPLDKPDGLFAIAALHLVDIPTLIAISGGKTREEAWKILRPLILAGVVLDHPDGYGHQIVEGLRIPLHTYSRDIQPNLFVQANEVAAVHSAYEIQQGDFSSVLELLWSRACLGDDIRKLEELMKDTLKAAASHLSKDRLATLKSKIDTAVAGEDFKNMLPSGAIASLRRIATS